MHLKFMVGLQETEGWINLAQGREHWQDTVK